MTRVISLGQSESSSLDFHGADALKQPFVLARAVVAMLNGEGGEVWVGIQEKEGRAVTLEAIPDAETARQFLREHLLDRIDPAPSARECDLELVEVAPGAILICIAVQPIRSKQPYAARKEGGLFFFVRTGDRVHTLSRDEALARAPRSRRQPDAIHEARERIGEERTALLRKKYPLFWLRILPVGKIALDLPRRKKEIASLLRHPSQTGNRDTGWNFAVARGVPTLRNGRITHGTALGLRMSLDEAGGLEVRTPLDMLYWQGDSHAIWPVALIELTASMFRLARELYRPAGASDSLMVFGDLALFEAREWTLRPHSPHSLGYLTAPPRAPGTELVWDRPLLFSLREVMEVPDRCAYRLVRRVYESFGYDETQTPADFDPRSGRLILPR